MVKNHPQHRPEHEGEPEADTPADGLIRLNKFMAELGVASRRRCDELIAGGKVSVDGEPCVELGTKIDPERQTVDVNGVVLKPLQQRKRYYLLNKPRHVLCTNEERELRTRAIDLITDRNKGRIFSVGRLDEDSSGLLILTNDGDFTNQIAHPRHSVPKTYLVKVRGRIDEEALAKISEGVRLSEGKTGGAALHVERRATEASVLTVTIREGKNREIRRVFAALGYKVLRLHRVRIGALSDRRLKDGEWRPLTPEEVADLLDIANNRERSEELFARARQGGFAKAPVEAEDGPRPGGRPEGRRVAVEGGRSRFGGARRDWHEPKDFRLKVKRRGPPRDVLAPGGESPRGKAEGPPYASPGGDRAVGERPRAGGDRDRARTGGRRTGGDRSRTGGGRTGGDRAPTVGGHTGGKRGGRRSSGAHSSGGRPGLGRAGAARSGGSRSSGVSGGSGDRRSGSGRAHRDDSSRTSRDRRGGGRSQPARGRSRR